MLPANLPAQSPLIPNGYRVTEDGKVYSVRRDVLIQECTGKTYTRICGGCFLKQVPNVKTGYMQVCLNRKPYNVHELVLLQYQGSKPTLEHQCRHLNNNRQDNRNTNLCWGTAQENTADKMQAGTVIKGDEHASAKLTCKLVFELRVQCAKGLSSIAEAAKMHGLSFSVMRRAIRGINWKHVPMPHGCYNHGSP